MFVWMAKFGAAYGVRTGIHVGVDVLINRLPPALAQGLRAVRAARRRAVHRHRRHARREVRLGHRATPTQCRPTSRCRSGSSTVRPARLVPDVLPLPAGRVGVLRTGELPHHDVAHVEGIDDASGDPDLHPRRSVEMSTSRPSPATRRAGPRCCRSDHRLPSPEARGVPRERVDHLRAAVRR